MFNGSQRRFGLWLGLSPLLGWMIGCGGASLRAHEGPAEVARQLTRQMESDGATALLLERRAREYQVLGRLDEAVEDLKAALVLDTDRHQARTELARIHLNEGRGGQALEEINRVLSGVKGGRTRAGLFMLRSEIHLLLGDEAAAWEDCEQAFRHPQPDLEWHLMRSRLQKRRGKHAEAARELHESYKSNGSHVLHEEWIEALIDAGDHAQAVREIEPLLDAARWRGSLLLRRARARLVAGENESARADLREALDEINGRMRAERPELTLLLDRALAWALMGEKDRAQADLNRAQRRGAPEWMLERLKTALAAP